MARKKRPFEPFSSVRVEKLRGCNKIADKMNLFTLNAVVECVYSCMSLSKIYDLEMHYLFLLKKNKQPVS